MFGALRITFIGDDCVDFISMILPREVKHLKELCNTVKPRHSRGSRALRNYASQRQPHTISRCWTSAALCTPQQLEDVRTRKQVLLIAP